MVTTCTLLLQFYEWLLHVLCVCSFMNGYNMYSAFNLFRRNVCADTKSLFRVGLYSSSATVISANEVIYMPFEKTDNKCVFQRESLGLVSSGKL